tara:strand:+ start:901 stop:1299 length:399 start_codon:yes stop_codon:yes gene_type:complete
MFPPICLFTCTRFIRLDRAIRMVHLYGTSICLVSFVLLDRVSVAILCLGSGKTRILCACVVIGVQHNGCCRTFFFDRAVDAVFEQSPQRRHGIDRLCNSFLRSLKDNSTNSQKFHKFTYCCCCVSRDYPAHI